jgi:adenylate kinase family enzyme
MDKAAPWPPARVVVVGTTGSGKTTTARRIAGAIDGAHIELDALHWRENWTEASADEFRALAREAVAAPRWAADGNYRNKAGDILWTAADTLVWLDYPFSTVIWQLLRRTIRRVATREELWAGNRERLGSQFLSRESLFVWAAQTHWKHRREYPEWFARPEFAHLRIVHARRRRDVERFLAAIPQSGEAGRVGYNRPGL